MHNVSHSSIPTLYRAIKSTFLAGKSNNIDLGWLAGTSHLNPMRFDQANPSFSIIDKVKMNYKEDLLQSGAENLPSMAGFRNVRAIRRTLAHRLIHHAIWQIQSSLDATCTGIAINIAIVMMYSHIASRVSSRPAINCAPLQRLPSPPHGKFAAEGDHKPSGLISFLRQILPELFHIRKINIFRRDW